MNIFILLFGERLSLRRRLVLNIIFALSFCAALATSILIKEFYEHLEGNRKDALTQEATEIMGQISPDADAYGLNPDAVRFQGVEGTYRYTVFDQDGGPVVGNETSAQIQKQLLAIAPNTSKFVELPAGRIGVGLRGRIKGSDFYVLASTFPIVSEKTKLELLIYEIKEGFKWIFLGFIAIIFAATLAARRALNPLKPILEQAQDIGPTAINKRLSTKSLPSEIAPLIVAVNGAFDRLEKGYQAQRDFSSNVAHEIRTPLAVLRSSIEVIDNPDLKKSIGEDVRRLDRMFEQMIDLSRADALGKSAYEDIDLHRLTVDLATDMGMDAIRAGKSLAVTGETESHAVGNKGLLSIALGNLMRNALIYSSKGTEVEIEVLTNPAGWKVMDRGAGVADDLKLVLFERFHRGAAANQQTSGSGIGLAIVKSVADAHDAQVYIQDRPGGGSAFVFIFSA